MKKKTKFKLLIFILIILVILTVFIFVPIKDFIVFNYNHRQWNESEYEQVNSFNRIQYGRIEDKNYTYRQFGEDVPKKPQLFSKKILKYLPKTKRWIIGIYGEKNTAANIGIIDCNKYINYCDKNGKTYPLNYIITDTNKNPVDSTMHGNILYMEINKDVLINNEIHIKIYRPDMSVYDDVIINLD